MPIQLRASVAFVLVTLGLDALGVGLIAPIVPGLVEHLGHLPPERAAPWVGALIAAYAAMQFFAAPVLGLVITSAAEAQSSQVPDPPKGQILLNGIMGKKQPAHSGKIVSGETQEQHDHHVKKDPYTQPLTSSSVRSHTGD